MTAEDFIRPRLVLDASVLPDGPAGEDQLRAALEAGDVATVVLSAGERSEAAFQDLCEALVPLIQEAGAAAIVAEDTRCAGRVKADGFHTGAGSLEALGEAVARFSPRLIVGASGFTTRHDALEAGERMPDYILFGKLGADTEAGPHPRNLDLSEWWAEIVEIPCIVQGGASLETLPAAIATRAEFVMLGRAVFGEGADPAQAVAEANRLFDEAQRRAQAA
ncbi:thiamine phosphate synthase [Aureimonas jatrophae]|uniref:Thiamine-phosphate diphosphorylase n=1 Tax=Aureimonas jatrophae TaxID=1166073 RepID=A0A1H0IG59_9HYPH|nr:thiamine phosphate synthase [Aureimonas jatrophae]MBB3952150.1 thiamine-phosphate pyrophosphorylase [Aureimonas jatrophae]SDO30383.1 thiamine-phosphate diphosphorylase [Aureimonas jatrophae]